MDLIAGREGIQPQQRKKWAKFWDAFGALAFAIAPSDSNFIRQDDGVNPPPPPPRMSLVLQCALSRHIVNGKLKVPNDRLWRLCCVPSWPPHQGATNTSGLESTRGLYAPKQKYYLPLVFLFSVNMKTFFQKICKGIFVYFVC